MVIHTKTETVANRGTGYADFTTNIRALDSDDTNYPCEGIPYDESGYLKSWVFVTPSGAQKALATSQNYSNAKVITSEDFGANSHLVIMSISIYCLLNTQISGTNSLIIQLFTSPEDYASIEGEPHTTTTSITEFFGKTTINSDNYLSLYGGGIYAYSHHEILPKKLLRNNETLVIDITNQLGRPLQELSGEHDIIYIWINGFTIPI